MSRLWVAIMFLCSASVSADSWHYKPIQTAETFRFGDLKIIQVTDAREDQHWPEFSVRIYRGEELLAVHANVNFEHLAVSPDGRTIVGVSNSGIPGVALAIFDGNGRLELFVHHRRNRAHYCRRTVTLDRIWVHTEKPDIGFDGDEVTVRDCVGNIASVHALIGGKVRRATSRK